MSSSVDGGCSLAKDDVGESAVGNEASPELVKELMQLKPLLPYVCHIKNCGKGHPTPSAYKFHARTYHGRNGRMIEKPLKCFNNTEEYVTSDGYDYRVDWHSYICPIGDCGSAFRTMGNWKSHFKNIHRKIYNVHVAIPLYSGSNAKLRVSREEVQRLKREKEKHDDGYLSDDNESDTEEGEVQWLPFVCTINDCARAFPTFEDYQIHAKTIHMQNDQNLEQPLFDGVNTLVYVSAEELQRWKGGKREMNDEVAEEAQQQKKRRYE